MINTLKRELNKITVELENTLNQGISNEHILNQIAQLENTLANDYENILNKPKYTKNKIVNFWNDLQSLGKLVYSYNLFLKNNMANEAKVEANKISELIQKMQFQNVRKPKNTNFLDTKEKMNTVANFMQSHIEKVGGVQAAKDFQVGLNLLNKNKKDSPIEAKQQLKDDGHFGDKTFTCFCDACKNYSPRVIQKYIRLGAIHNAIFETKNDKRINTDKAVCLLCDCLKPERNK